jgi:flagellar hook-length control protein FliK
VLPVAHAIPDAVDIPATRATGDAAPDAVVAATAAPVHQAAVHASTTVTHSDDDPRPVRSVAAPLRHAVREAAERMDGEHTITIRLDPPELGTVRIRVEAHGEKVSVTLHTELAEAKTELQTKHRDIADILRNEGFTLDGFDVDTSDQRPQRDDKQQQHRSAPTPSDVFELQDQLDDGELRL